MINIFDKVFKILKSLFYIFGVIMLICGFILVPESRLYFMDSLVLGFKYVFYFTIAIGIYMLLRVNIPKIIVKLNSVSVEFDNKNCKVSKKRAKIIKKALAGDKKSQYELINEFYERSESPDFIPDICFYFTKHISDERSDLGVIVQLGNMYEEGVGVRKNKNKALEIYKCALDLCETPTPNLYIPDDKDYRKFIIDLINSIN